MSNFDDLKLAVEALSGGKNTVLFDDDLGTGGGEPLKPNAR